MRSNLKSVRTLFAAILACVLVVGPLGLSGAQAELEAFDARANGFAVGVQVQFPEAIQGHILGNYASLRDALPDDLRSQLPENPLEFTQLFGITQAEANDDAVRAVSDLGDGVIDLPEVSANEQGQDNSSNADSAKVPPQVEGLDASVIEAVGGLLRASVQQGPRVEGEATLAEVNATLTNLGELFPAELQTAFADLVQAVNDTLDTAATVGEDLNTALEDAANETESTLGGTPLGDTLADAGLIDEGGVVDTGSDLSDQVLAAFAAIDVPNPLDPDVNLAEVTDVSSITTAQKTEDGKSSADAVSQIKTATVLDGLLSVGLINIASHSEADGTPGSASNSSSCSLADVRLGGNNGVSLDGETLYVEVDGEPVAVPVADSAVDELRTQVTNVLNTAGVSIELCDSATANADPEGLTADQQVSAFVVTIEPKAPADIPALGISEGDPLAKIIIDPTVSTAVAAAQADPEPDTPALPRTGPAAIVTILSGIALAGGGLALRRRILR